MTYVDNNLSSTRVWSRIC